MSDDVSSYGSTREVEGPYDEEDWAADYEEALDNVATIAGSDLITGLGQLHLLARLKHEGYDADTLHPLGRTIHHLDAANGPVPGPLPERPQQLVSFLQDDVSTSIYGSLPQCDAGREEVNGQPALYVETRRWSTVPLDKFDTMVDPINWPKCPLQATFFKSMVPDGAPDQPLPFPEKKGGRNNLIETVDFGMGVLGSVFAMETVLSVM